MKKVLLTAAMFIAVSSVWAGIGDDLTDKYLQNADFSQGTPVTGRICTYDYDMKDTYTMYGLQSVEGWTATRPSDNTWFEGHTDDLNACAGGIFAVGAYDDDDNHLAELGGAFYAPDANSQGQEVTGQVLGLIAVWSRDVQYTQQVTLPAGAYTIQVAAYNAAGTGTVNSNLFGFIAENGTKYVVEKTAWEEGVWMTDEVSFILTEPTTGVISLGYVASHGGSGAMPHLFIDDVKIIEASKEALELEQAKVLKDEQLLPLLEVGDELGVNTQEGWAVYKNETATLQEVQDAIEKQQAINDAGTTDFTDFFISNAHFALGTPLDNGVCTYAKDMEANGTTYFGMQSVQDWTPNDPGTDGKASGLFAVGRGESAWLGSKDQGYVAPDTKSNGATEGNVFGFVGVWMAEANYTQQVTLPAGSYTITIPTYNAKGGTSAIVKNLCGFIASDGTEYLAETKLFPVNVWHKETIRFTLEEETSGVISIGYVADNKGSADMPHLFIDEFLLTYNGVTDIDPSLIALTAAIRSGESYVYDEALCEKVAVTELEQALDAAYVLKNGNSNDVEANTAATVAINNAIQTVKNSIEVYAQFNDFIEGELNDVIIRYSEGDMSEFAGSLADDRDNYNSSYEAGEYTTEQIYEIINGFATRVKAAVQEKLTEVAADGQLHNLDISVLFENVNFANRSTAGWKATQLTSGKFESQQNGVAEVWSNSPVDFSVSTTLANLPAGAYSITAPAWYRKAGDAVPGYELKDDPEAGKSYIFANGNKTELVGQYVEQLLGDEDEMHNAAVGDAYTPNGQAQAQAVFYRSDIDVTNTVSTVLTEEGDLTIGFKGENLNSGTWTVWGGLTIVYKGADEALTLAALNGEIEALVAEAADLRDNTLAANVSKAVSDLDEKASAGEQALEADEVAVKKAAIDGLKLAVAYAKESITLVNKLFEVNNLYAGLQQSTEIKSTDDTLDALLEESNPENELESNEAVEGYIAALPKAWTQYVCAQNGMAAATEAQPVDVTPAILNPGFEGVLSDKTGAEYWTVTKDAGSEGYLAGIYEFYNNNSFELSQTIEGLTPGYYAVKVQSMYRSGNNEPNVNAMVADTLCHVQLYANGREVNIKNQLELEDVPEYSYTAGAGVNVGSEVTVSYKDNEAFIVPNDRTALAEYFAMGLYQNEIQCEVGKDGTLTFGLKKTEHEGGDWCPFDNFQLLYLGTTMPTGVECIKPVADTKSADIYDLQGRKLQKPGKGLYIKAGKVFIMK